MSERKSICILGATGTFGRLITKSLVRDNIPVILVGRRESKLVSFKKKLSKEFPNASIQTAAFDIITALQINLEKLMPCVVINTAGPFQYASYNTAKICIMTGVHYIDLADGRNYVDQFNELDKFAKDKKVIAITGASTIPALSSVVIDEFKKNFKQIDSLDYGITPGAKSPRGIATTQSVLSYLGKPFKANGKKVYGWQSLHREKYPVLGKRWMGNCDIPDLDLFPAKYGIKNIRFYAGMESSGLHLSIWLLSWLKRLGLPINLANHANLLSKISHIFDIGGSKNGGMHMIFKGTGQDDKPLTIKWFMVIKNGGGPNVPTIPSIVLAKKILAGEYTDFGARPCVSLVKLDEYLKELSRYDSQYFVERE